MTDSEKNAFERGAYFAFNEVLLYLNALNDEYPSKNVVYKNIMSFTPERIMTAFPVPQT